MAKTIRVRGGLMADGTGREPFRADVEITGDAITAVGKDLPGSADAMIDAGGRIVAPGFIDAHSHADGGLLDAPDAETQIRQGITTAVVGQDGGSNYPLAAWFARVTEKRVAVNVASFVGHGTARGRVLGEDYKRPATAAEIRKMQALVDSEMKAGALGLSTGLEYEPGLYAETPEVVALARATARYGGIYISHVRDEEDDALAAFRELVRVAEEARIPAQISHVKLALAPVWGKTGEVFRLLDGARARGLDITADVYPYTYWQSNIVVLLPPKTDARADRAAWERALKNVGGAGNVLLTGADPESAWQGKTLAEVAALLGKPAADAALELMARSGGKGTSAVVTAMREDDVRAFVKHPRVMFCTDGGLRGSHPRGAGSYPRFFGKYVRDDRVLPLGEAVRKASGFPAERFGLRDRGRIAPGYKADLVIFDPKTVRDTATTRDPRAAPVGIADVLVNGVPVLRDGKPTGERPGTVLRRPA
jgi:N-acyl-D-amino-acid deacylase